MIHRRPASSPENPEGANSQDMVNRSRHFGDDVAVLSPVDGSLAAEAVEPDVELGDQNLLSKRQRQRLGQFSSEAFRYQKSLGLVDDGVKVDDWRHAEISEATGGKYSGLTHTPNNHFKQLASHFLTLAGNLGDAFRYAVNEQTELDGYDQAHWLLKQETLKWDYDFPSYPDSLCRAICKCPLSEATPKQLRGILYNVRTNGRTKASKAAKDLTPETAPDE